MDWGKVRQSVTPKADAPAATLIEVCWYIRRTPNGKVIPCGIYRDTAPGLEVRCGFSDDDLLRSQRAPEIGTAREIADAWRRAVLAKGFVEITDEGNEVM